MNTKRDRKKLLPLEILGICLGLLWLAPLYLMLINAFKSPSEIFANVLAFPAALSFANFVQAYQELEFLKSLFNSVMITGVSLLLIVIFSSMAAYALSRNKSKLSSVIFYLFVAAMLIPFQSVMIPLISMFGQGNMLNAGGLIFMYLGFGCSLAIFLYHGAMSGIPKTLDEAATIDGANRFQIFWYIIFPLLKPITVTVAILNVIWIWNDFLLPSLILGESNATLPLKMFFFFGEFTRQWHLALAGLTLAVIPVLIGYFIAQKQIIKGVSEGAIK